MLPPYKNSGSYSSLSYKPNAQLLPEGQSADRCPRRVADGGPYIVGQYADESKTEGHKMRKRSGPTAYTPSDDVASYKHRSADGEPIQVWFTTRVG